MGGILGTLGKWIFGAGGNAAVGIAKGVNDIVDEHVATVQNKEAFTKDVGNLVEQSVASARAFAAPGTHNTAFDALVDGINRLIRPLVTVAILGDWFSWWQLRDLDALTPAQQWLVYTVIGFWFGGRALTKDVPAAVASLWTTIKKG